MDQLSQADHALTAAADAVAAARADVTRLQAELAADVEGLRARWAGAGALAFQQVHAAWQDRQSRITAALDGFEASLRETERDNLRTDEAQADGFAAALARLG